MQSLAGLYLKIAPEIRFGRDFARSEPAFLVSTHQLKIITFSLKLFFFPNLILQINFVSVLQKRFTSILTIFELIFENQCRKVNGGD